MPARHFDANEFLPQKMYDRITDLRVEDPQLCVRLAGGRVRRESLTEDGKLTLLAADHTARMVTRIRDGHLRMGDRRKLLSRVLRVVACSSFDGFLATADIFDELNIIQHLAKKRSFLDGKVILGSINRGGLAGTAFELDDKVTGYDVDGITEMRLDGAKFLLRFDPSSRDSKETLEYCVKTIRACASKKIPVFVEPFPVKVAEGAVKIDYDPDKIIRLVGAVSGLGSHSSSIWLKLPYCERFGEVARSTTLPILLLGGETGDEVAPLLAEIESAMKAGPNVRGVLLGRNLLFPPVDDPLPLAQAINSIVHGGVGAEEAEASMTKWEGKSTDMFGAND